MDSALVAWEIILLMSILRTQGIITLKTLRKICFSISFQLCQDTVIELLRRKTFSALSTWNSSGISMAWLRPDEFVSTDHRLQANSPHNPRKPFDVLDRSAFILMLWTNLLSNIPNRPHMLGEEADSIETVGASGRPQGMLIFESLC